jgi:mannose-6-phosphate isomerase-like protein (cupin superfamily)
MQTFVADYRTHVGVSPTKFHKATLFGGSHMMVGLNCLEPGQVQPVHDRAGQDKFYLVLEGSGMFTVGDAVVKVGPGHVVWAGAGMPHGVRNEGKERLVVLVGMAPPP